MKKTIRLSESDLHRVIKRAVYEATKGEMGMSDKQKQRSRNANYIKDVNGSGDKYFHPNTYSDYEPSNVDRYEGNAPFHGNDWFDDKVHTDRMKKHRSSQNHKDPDDFMESIVRESIKRVVNESYLYTKDINTDDLRINGHWTEDGYAEWEATVDNGWYTLRGTYDGHDCELEEIIEGHSGHGIQHDIDDDAIDWFNQNICDRVKSWLDKYAENYSDWHSNMYGDE